MPRTVKGMKRKNDLIMRKTKGEEITKGEEGKRALQLKKRKERKRRHRSQAEAEATCAKLA